MEVKEQIIAGLDIGSSEIVAAVGRVNFYGELEVLGTGVATCEGVLSGAVHNVRQTIDAIKQALHLAEERSEIDISVVNVGISGTYIQSAVRQGSLALDAPNEEVTARDVDRLMYNLSKMPTPEGHHIIHLVPQRYRVDDQPTDDPVGMLGSTLSADCYVTTAETHELEKIRLCIKQAGVEMKQELGRKHGLEIDSLMPAVLAASLATLSKEEKELGIGVVDIGGGTTDWAIFYDSVLVHTDTLPLGGEVVSADIKAKFKVLKEQAEMLKVSYGYALAEQAKANEVVAVGLPNRKPKEILMQNLALVIESRMEEIIEIIHKQMIRLGYAHKLVSGLVITGGSAQLKGLPELWQMMTKLDTKLGVPENCLGKNTYVRCPRLAAATGLMQSKVQSLDPYEKRIHAPSNKNDSPSSHKEGAKNMLERLTHRWMGDID